MVTPQVEILKHANKVISMVQASANIPLAKEFTINSQTQGALALEQNVANNPMLQLEKASGISRLRDFDLITYFDTSCERR
ncbi:MAG: hypothetical protein KH044_02990 [Veillonella sp.]|uniref:hypothetical protein n=1 Tax=Veillonella sp. TaxID=1926307 RepID=UPI00257C2677|nr:MULTISPECIES: hypothetical protein [Bacillota]MBS7163963.1 hypothetical protein [Veillonella sp.]